MEPDDPTPPGLLAEPGEPGVSDDVSPLDGAMPPIRLACALLGEAGGVAGVGWLAERMTAAKGEGYTVRRVRDLLRRSPQIRKLGAGYYALPRALAEPVADWAAGWLAERGAAPLEELLAALLAAYPRGDAASARRWLEQGPSRLQLSDGRVRATRRWKGA